MRLMNKLKTFISILLLLGFCIAGSETAVASSEFDNIPKKGTVTMIDLGAGSCIPCKMMVPILDRVSARYKGKADIVVIDLRYNREQASRFNIRAIPTQIFFDREGKEVYRHMGFLDESSIEAQLLKMGIK